MYNRFKILSIKPLIGEKAVAIETNYEISSLSVTPANIRITNPGDPLEELLWKDFSVEGKIITIFLISEPRINYQYVVRIEGLTNIIDEKLETDYKQSIEFKSYISSSIQFIAPTMHSIVNKLELVLQEDVFQEGGNSADYFEMQISSEPLFQTKLLPDQNVYAKSVTFDLDYNGQIFTRCRAHYKSQKEPCFGNWITTTFVLSNNTTDDENSDNTNDIFKEELKVIDMPNHNQSDKELVYRLNTQELLSVGAAYVSIRPILGDEHTIKNIEIETVIEPDRIVVYPKEPIPSNHFITVILKNIKSQDDAIQDFSQTFCGILAPCYSSLLDIKSILNSDIDLEPELVYYHLIEASKLADYYEDIKLNSSSKNYKYYKKVEYANDFEKGMFVKYYAAGQIFSQIRSSVIYDMSLSGKLGDIEVSPKGSLPDFSSFLRELSSEAEKWRLALQGHKNHTAEPRSAIKSKSCLPHDHYRGGR